SEEKTVANEVIKRGIKHYDGFRLNRYFSLKDWLYDLKYIRCYVEKEGIDIIHTNLAHDHFLALLAMKFSRKKPLIVRTDHKRDGIPRSPFMRWALSGTDSLVAYSKKIIDHDVAIFGYPVERTCIIPPGLKPFDKEKHDVRKGLGLDGDVRIIGVVGRLKRDRGYEVILKAFKLVKGRLGNVKLLVMGRGGSQDNRVINTMIGELAVEDDVILAGYRSDDYFSMIGAFDVYVMMRAGTDGTARALREVMSMGIPPVVSDLGMLPELVDDGVNGYVVSLDENMLADRLTELLADGEKRLAFGKKAKEKALSCWSYKRQAVILKQFYEELLASRK
ncbi:MAG TPA: glycosyltransferase, partial [Desulfomonilia bacterium]|nr:glycosyltransferase [Desulfomonilia bacterium]